MTTTTHTPSAATKTAAAQRDPREYLDNLSLSRKEGWRDMVDAAPRVRPETLSVSQIRQLGTAAAEDYHQARSRWHAQMGTIVTSECRSVLEQLEDFMAANCQSGEDTKPLIALSGLPGLGKSTIARVFGRRFHQQQIAAYGPLTRTGDERWPVCRVGMTGSTGIREFNTAVCDFYAHPGIRRATAAQLLQRALDCVTCCETRLLIIDDLHFLHGRYQRVAELSNQFKYIANEFPVAVLFIGIGLHERDALLDDTRSYDELALEQLLRSTIPISMSPFSADTAAGRRHWRDLLLTLEQRLVLAHAEPGMLVDDLSDYLFIRSTGHIGSLMSLIRLGCQKAIRTGTEALTAALLDTCRIDSAAELGRRELEAAFRTGKKTTRVPRP